MAAAPCTSFKHAQSWTWSPTPSNRVLQAAPARKRQDLSLVPAQRQDWRPPSLSFLQSHPCQGAWPQVQISLGGMHSPSGWAHCHPPCWRVPNNQSASKQKRRTHSQSDPSHPPLPPSILSLPQEHPWPKMGFLLLDFLVLSLYLQSPFNRQSLTLLPSITSLTPWYNRNHSPHISSSNHHHIHTALQPDQDRDHPSILHIPQRTNSSISNLMTGTCHHRRRNTT